MTFDDIRERSYYLTSTTSSDIPNAKMNREVNTALDHVVSLIMASDGRWQYDDSNYADLPTATTALVQNQQDYSLATSHLEISRVEIMDTSSNWQKLTPLDQTDVYNQSLTDFLKTAGSPVYYDKISNSVFLYPKPNYSQSASLKLYFERGPLHYDYTTGSDAGRFSDGNGIGATTDSPGFNSLFHDLIPLWVAYNFGLANGKSNVNTIMAEIVTREDQLREFYSLRSKDDPIKLKVRPYSFR